MGDDKLVFDLLVGDLQRVIEYPARGSRSSRRSPPGSRMLTGVCSQQASIPG
jgi:hypothetical protein